MLLGTLKHIKVATLNAKQRDALRKTLEKQAKELRTVIQAIEAHLAQLGQAPKTAKKSAKKRY
jgi:hypothetical protein